MNTENSLAFITVAHEPKDLGAGRRATPRPMIIQCRRLKKRRLGAAVWWLWPTTWAAGLTIAYLTTDILRDTVQVVLAHTGF